MKKAEHEQLHENLDIALIVAREATDKARVAVAAAKDVLRRCLDTENLVAEAREYCGLPVERAAKVGEKPDNRTPTDEQRSRLLEACMPMTGK